MGSGKLRSWEGGETRKVGWWRNEHTEWCCVDAEGARAHEQCLEAPDGSRLCKGMGLPRSDFHLLSSCIRPQGSRETAIASSNENLDPSVKVLVHSDPFTYR